MQWSAGTQTLLHQYLVCDSALLFQIYYYRWKNPHADQAITREIEPIENTPLLGNPVEPKRRNHWSMESEVLKYSLCLVFVFAAGLLAWAIDVKIRGPTLPNEPGSVMEWRSQVLGWFSATLFRTSSMDFNFAVYSTLTNATAVGARIPQIRE